MENCELQKIWKGLESQLVRVPDQELTLLLVSKARQIMKTYLFIEISSVFVSLGLIVYLLLTAILRWHDPIYVVNNVVLGLITIFALISGMNAVKKLKIKSLDQPLSALLEERVILLSKWLTGKFSKLYLYILPPISLLLILSIHVFFESQSFKEVLNDQESCYGLIMGFLAELVVAYAFVLKIRKKQLIDLDFLKDMYNRLIQPD